MDFDDDRDVPSPRGTGFGPTDVLLKPSSLPPGPWVYRKMIGPPARPVQNGAYLLLRSRGGAPVARGFLNRNSEIAFRVVASPSDPEDVEELLAKRIEAARHLREKVLDLPARTNAWRILNAEGDRLSGLVVDRYAATCVVSLHSIGYVAAAESLERVLRRIPGVERVLFRADERTQKLEKFRLPPLPAGLVETVHEGRLKFKVDLSEGHKTGLFLDQRDSRERIGGLAKGRRVLDLCTNAGGFAMAAALGGARSVVGLDLDEVALARAKENARTNRAGVEFVHADLFPWLRARIEARESYDLVVLDPPKLAKSRTDAKDAIATYRDMNALAFRAVAPGGLLFTCSCSGAIDEGSWLETVRRAAREAGRSGQVLELRGAAPDHPIALEFPEGRYLKAALIHVA